MLSFLIEFRMGMSMIEHVKSGHNSALTFKQVVFISGQLWFNRSRHHSSEYSKVIIDCIFKIVNFCPNLIFYFCRNV